MTDYGFKSDDVPKVVLRTNKKEVQPKDLKNAVETGKELGFISRSTTPTVHNRRRRATEPQGKILITGPERVLEKFRALSDEQGVPYWRIIKHLMDEI